MMRELVIGSLNLWITVPDHFDMDGQGDYWDWLLFYVVQAYEILTGSRGDWLLSIIYCYCVNPCYWKLLGNDCLTVATVQFYCSSYTRLLLLFTVTDIVHRVYDYWLTVTVLLLLLSPYRPSILDNIDIDWFNWID